jgi:hypothetical protein
MPISSARWGVLVFSWSAGVMYSTLFTMPYLLVAHYHETDTVGHYASLYFDDEQKKILYLERGSQLPSQNRTKVP